MDSATVVKPSVIQRLIDRIGTIDSTLQRRFNKWHNNMDNLN